jgi:cell division protein FtsA
MCTHPVGKIYAVLKRIIDTKREVAILDIGTSKICCAIGRGIPNGKNDNPDISENERSLRILGAGYHSARGIKKNSITNLEELEEAILNAISSAEKDAQKSIKSVFVSLPSWAIESISIETHMALGQLPVDDVHINFLLNFDASRYINTETREIIHIFPIAYSIDDAFDIQDPIGMVGENITASLNVLTAPSALIKNIRNCIRRNNIEVEGFISSTYAAGLSVLLNEELTFGVTLIDFGGSVTTVAFFYGDNLLYIKAIPVGAENITNDISIILRTLHSHAERLKILYGVSSSDSSSSLNDVEQCLIPRIDEYGEEHMQNVSKTMLDSIIRARLEEIVELVQEKVNEVPIMTRKIVITGGGSKIAGLSEFIKMNGYFKNSFLRLGKPIKTIGSHDFVQTPSFASTAGSMLYCLSSDNFRFSNNKSLIQKIATWFKRGV